MSTEYKPNSHKSKDEAANQQKVEKVVTNPVKEKKQTGVRKLVNDFVSNDVTNIQDYIMSEVIIPAAKKVVSDTVGGIAEIIRNSVNVCLYGEAGARKMRSSGGSKISYEKCYDNVNKERPIIGTRRKGFRYEEFTIDSRGEAEEVLSTMIELVTRYEVATVANLNEALGITGDYTDCNYGWTDLRDAHVVRIRDGYDYAYVIKMPRPEPLEK